MLCIVFLGKAGGGGGAKSPCVPLCPPGYAPVLALLSAVSEALSMCNFVLTQPRGTKKAQKFVKAALRIYHALT